MEELIKMVYVMDPKTITKYLVDIRGKLEGKSDEDEVRILPFRRICNDQVTYVRVP